MCVKPSFIGSSYSFYAVVVVRSRTPDANQAVYIDAQPYVNNAPYYIAAAWAQENISRVPLSFTVGLTQYSVAAHPTMKQLRNSGSKNIWKTIFNFDSRILHL